MCAFPDDLWKSLVLEQELVSQHDEGQPTEQPNPAELMRDLADVKARLSKIGSGSTNDNERSRLVNAVLTDVVDQPDMHKERLNKSAEEKSEDVNVADISTFAADIDRRLGALEKAIGSSTTALDEVRTAVYIIVFF